MATKAAFSPAGDANSTVLKTPGGDGLTHWRLGGISGGSEAKVVLQHLFRPRPERQIGAALFAAAAQQARQAAFYAVWGAPDTAEGRFELYSLHVILLLERLRGLSGEAGDVRQALFDAYLRSLDDALRDMGVGDLSVGKKMRKLGEAFYGRAKSYEAALGQPAPALEALLARTVFEGVAEGRIDLMSAYVRHCQAELAAQPVDVLIAGGAPDWAEVAS